MLQYVMDERYKPLNLSVKKKERPSICTRWCLKWVKQALCPCQKSKAGKLLTSTVWSMINHYCGHN